MWSRTLASQPCLSSRALTTLWWLNSLKMKRLHWRGGWMSLLDFIWATTGAILKWKSMCCELLWCKSPIQYASVRGDLLFLKDVGNLTEWAEDRAMKFYTPQTTRQASVRWACLCLVISLLTFLEVLSIYCRYGKVAESSARCRTLNSCCLTLLQSIQFSKDLHNVILLILLHIRDWHNQVVTTIPATTTRPRTSQTTTRTLTSFTSSTSTTFTTTTTTSSSLHALLEAFQGAT